MADILSPLMIARLLALGRILLSLCCLAGVGGAVAEAPEPVWLDAAEPDRPRFELDITPVVPNPVDVNLGTDVAQFDLVCRALGREVTDGPDGPGGEPPARPWMFNFRYFVDLDSRKYCDPYRCQVSGVWRIQSVDAETITFLNGRREGFTLETVDRRSGRYSRRSADGGREWLDEGTCRQEPFSGFPDTSSAIMQDPWGPDGEWVGDQDGPKPTPGASAQTR